MANSIGTAIPQALPLATDDNPTAISNLLTFLQQIKSNYLETKLGQSNIDISGVPDLLHGTRTLILGPSLAAVATGSPTPPINTAPYWAAAAGTDVVRMELPMEIGRRINTISVIGRANGATAWSFKAWKTDMSSGTVTQLSTTQTSAVTAAISTLSVSNLLETVAANVVYCIEWTGGAAANRFYGVSATYDRPV